MALPRLPKDVEAPLPDFPSDPIASATKGAVVGVLQFSKNEIKALVTRFRNKKVAFLHDEETIEVVRKSRESPELAFFKNYVKDPQKILLIQTGIGLRELEGRPLKLSKARDAIFAKHNAWGVHLAQCAQTPILRELIQEAIVTSTSENLQANVNDLLGSIDKRVLFVKAEDDAMVRARQASNLVDAHQPLLFVLAGSGYANVVVERTVKALKLPDYIVSTIAKPPFLIHLFARKAT